jgi:uncharacterized protein involved in cysteine biosynthesis
LHWFSPLAVGYGEIVPATQCGRVAMVFAAFSGLVFIALLVNSINSWLALAPFEMRMIEFLNAEKLKEQKLNSAATVITLAIKQYVVRHIDQLSVNLQRAVSSF